MRQLVALLGIGFGTTYPLLTAAQSNTLSREERALLLEDSRAEESSEKQLEKGSKESRAQNSTRREKTEDSLKDEKKLIEETFSGPPEVPSEHILVIQKRPHSKENKHEITPLIFGTQPADSFRRQYLWGFGYAYHLTDSFGLEVAHITFSLNSDTGLEDALSESTGLRTKLGDRVVYQGASSLLWTPIKAKIAGYAAIRRLELTFGLGGGFAVKESETAGLGVASLQFKTFVSNSSLFRFEVRDFADFSEDVAHRVSVLAGFGVLL